MIWGGRYSSKEAGWWRTSIFFRLTSSPKSWAASARQDVMRCYALFVCATRASSSAKRRSRISCSRVFVCPYRCLRLNRLPSRWYLMYPVLPVRNQELLFRVSIQIFNRSRWNNLLSFLILFQLIQFIWVSLMRELRLVSYDLWVRNYELSISRKMASHFQKWLCQFQKSPAIPSWLVAHCHDTAQFI